jgi:hypothetical protein
MNNLELWETILAKAVNAIWRTRTNRSGRSATITHTLAVALNKKTPMQRKIPSTFSNMEKISFFIH